MTGEKAFANLTPEEQIEMEAVARGLGVSSDTFYNILAVINRRFANDAVAICQEIGGTDYPDSPLVTCVLNRFEQMKGILELMLGILPDGFKQDSEDPACPVCGCTQDDCNQCIESTGKPCQWILITPLFSASPDVFVVCSACVKKALHGSKLEEKQRVAG